MNVALIALLTTVLTAGAFPPFDRQYLAFVALVPLLVYTRGAGGRKSLLAGWLGGWAASTAVVWWVINTITHYGGLSWTVALPILLLLTGAMGFFWGIFFWARRRILDRWPAAPDFLTAPALWVALEYLRGHLPDIAFPWALMGSSQYLNLRFIQGADIFGIWGISYLVVMINCAVAALLDFPAWKRRGRLATVAPVLVAAGAAALAAAYGAGRLDAQGREGGLKLAVLQGNVDQSEKWIPANKKRTYELYESLTRQAAAESAGLVVWPETAMPFIFEREPSYQRRIEELAAGLGVPLLFGSPGVATVGERTTLRNRAYFVDGEGRQGGYYDKRRLVPFGEYVPWKRLLFFVEKMVGMTGEFTSGTLPTVFEAGGHRFGTLICYEGIFPELARLPVLRGAQFLVNITNDAWFGRTAASRQQLAALVFRAIENRRPLARAANTGISGFVDSRGRILAASDIFVQGSYVAEIDPSSELTIYTRWGDWFALLCLGVSLALLALTLRKSRGPRYHL